jgi:hypothetical protein
MLKHRLSMKSKPKNFAQMGTMLVGLKSGLSAAQSKQALSTTTVSAAKNVATASTVKFTGALKGLGLAIAANPIGLIVVTLTTLFTVMQRVKQAAEETARVNAENIRLHREQTDTLKEQIKAFDELNSRRMNAQNFAEVRDINDEILELQRGIRDTIGSQASEIDLVNGKYEETLALLNRIHATRRIRETKNLFVYDEDEDRYRSKKFHISADSYSIRCTIK